MCLLDKIFQFTVEGTNFYFNSNLKLIEVSNFLNLVLLCQMRIFSFVGFCIGKGNEILIDSIFYQNLIKLYVLQLYP